MKKDTSANMYKTEMFDSLQEDFTRGAPQYELNILVTMAT